MEPARPARREEPRRGLRSVAKGKAVGARTQRERDYLDALGAMYADYGKVDHRTRMLAYTKAMEQLAQRYPKDDEAQIYYALALNTSASPADKTYANQLKGAAILEEIAKRQPEHPGVTHYLIHLYDTPALAEKGLDAARRYSKIAPAAAHAQHMPSHVFTRVGYWTESIESNAVSAARCGKRQRRAMTSCMPWTTWSMPTCRSARTARPSTVIERDEDGERLHRDFPAGPYALAAVTGALRRRTRRLESRGAVAGPAEPAGPYAGDHSFCSRARRGALGRCGCRQPRHRYGSQSCGTSCVRARMRTGPSKWTFSPGCERVGDVCRGQVRRCAERDEAAADAEDATEKHPVTPGVLKPARELYGVMLLERGNNEALAAFEATLKKEPNRLGASVGAAKAAERSATRPRPGSIARGSSQLPEMPTRPGPRLPMRAPS